MFVLKCPCPRPRFSTHGFVSCVWLWFRVFTSSPPTSLSVATSILQSNMSSSSHSRSRSVSSRRRSRCSEDSADFGVASHRDRSPGLSPVLTPRSPSAVRSVDGESMTSLSYAPTSPGGTRHVTDTIPRGHPPHEAPLTSLHFDEDAPVADDGYGVLHLTSPRAISHPPSPERIAWLQASSSHAGLRRRCSSASSHRPQARRTHGTSVESPRPLGTRHAAAYACSSGFSSVAS